MHRGGTHTHTEREVGLRKTNSQGGREQVELKRKRAACILRCATVDSGSSNRMQIRCRKGPTSKTPNSWYRLLVLTFLRMSKRASQRILPKAPPVLRCSLHSPHCYVQERVTLTWGRSKETFCFDWLWCSFFFDVKDFATVSKPSTAYEAFPFTAGVVLQLECKGGKKSLRKCLRTTSSRMRATENRTTTRLTGKSSQKTMVRTNKNNKDWKWNYWELIRNASH